MNRTRILTTLAVAVGVALAAACGGDGDGTPGPTPGGPGTLKVVLNASDNNAAAIQFSVSGASITNVQAGTGLTIHQRSAGNTVNIAALGAIGAGSTVATFDVQDVNGTYTVSVVDVADNTNQLLNKSNYSLTVQK